MNYQEINEAILSDRDINENLVSKNKRFYKYLLNNKVAYYYSKYLSRNPNEKEHAIVRGGEKLNKKYRETLKLLIEATNKHNIDFLLYKTHKAIPEVVDGDIDLFVRKNNFEKLLMALENAEFQCKKDEPGKGKCIKKEFNTIEPHITVSWRGIDHLNPSEIWENLIQIEWEGLKFNNCSQDIEAYSAIGKALYEPAYIDLYTLKVLQKDNYSSSSLNIKRNLVFQNILEQLEHKKILTTKFPFFLSTSSFLYLWTKTYLQKGNTETYLWHIIFFLYWKYRYRFVSVLPFTHEW